MGLTPDDVEAPIAHFYGGCRLREVMMEGDFEVKL